MTWIASGPATCGTGGSAGLGAGNGAGTIAAGAGAAGAGAAPGSGVGAVLGRGAQPVKEIAATIEAMLTNLVVIMDARSSSCEADCRDDTTLSPLVLQIVPADMHRSTYIPAMPWHDPHTLNSFSRAGNLGALTR